jgi:IS30 family transposase
VPRYAWNKSSPEAKARYFELIRRGWSGSSASGAVGVSLSCGSLWFIDAGSVSYVESPISSRFLSQDDRIEIADGLARGEPVKAIAARIGKTPQSVCREIARNRKPDGRYQPWFAHNQAYLRRRSRAHKFEADAELRRVVADKLARRWSPAQISRWRRRRWPRRGHWHVCHETIYEAVYRGLIVVADRQALRTGRLYRRRRGRGRTREGGRSPPAAPLRTAVMPSARTDPHRGEVRDALTRQAWAAGAPPTRSPGARRPSRPLRPA